MNTLGVKVIAGMGESMGKVLHDVKNLWDKCLVREEIG